jgi:hypothetical protein
LLFDYVPSEWHGGEQAAESWERVQILNIQQCNTIYNKLTAHHIIELEAII